MSVDGMFLHFLCQCMLSDLFWVLYLSFIFAFFWFALMLAYFLLYSWASNSWIFFSISFPLPHCTLFHCEVFVLHIVFLSLLISIIFDDPVMLFSVDPCSLIFCLVNLRFSCYFCGYLLLCSSSCLSQCSFHLFVHLNCTSRALLRNLQQ